MSPEVKEARRGTNYRYFTIDLNSKKDFDPKKFLAQARKVSYNTNEKITTVILLKFFCAGDIMYLFRDSGQTYHDQVYDDLVNTGVISSKPQCGGQVSVLASGDELEVAFIQGHSASLALKGLMEITSHVYKHNIIRKRFPSEFFKIS